MVLILGSYFALTMERQFKEKLNSIKIYEACLYAAVSSISIYNVVKSLSELLVHFGAPAVMCIRWMS